MNRGRGPSRSSRSKSPEEQEYRWQESKSHSASPIGKLRTLLKQFGLRPIKKLGQNFLVDEDVLSDIVDGAELTKDDLAIEVGPGLGVLTKALCERVRHVFAVEFESEFASALATSMREFSNLTVINEDILRLAPLDILLSKPEVLNEEGKGSIALAQAQYKVVANLPYYITSPVLRHFLEATLKPKLMVIMVQKEVAQRIVAKPGNLSLLGVSVQVYGSPRIVRMVSARSFYPPPKVDSAVVRIDVYDKPAVDVEDMKLFFQVVSAGFSQPRKQLHNTIGQRIWLPPGGATSLLESAGIDPERRAQTLTLKEWETLCIKLAEFRHRLQMEKDSS